MKVAAVFLSAFVAAALGMPLVQDVVHEKRDVITSAKLVKLAPADGDKIVPVRIALKQRNLERGMELLMDVADPTSKNYGNHYTQDQVVDLFSPEQNSIDTVKRWLVDAGVPANAITSPKSKGWVDFTTTVSKLENLLKTDYNIYQHTPTRSEHVGTDKYTLPSEVAQHVDFIQPAVVMGKLNSRSTTNAQAAKRPGGPAIAFQPLREKQQDSTAVDTCAKKMTPACIKSLYNIPAGTLANANNRLGIFESDNEEHTQSDLNLFYSKYATNIPKGTGPKIDLIAWGSQKPDPSQAVGEAALDFDVSVPIIYPQGTEVFQTKSNFDGQSTLGFINQFLDGVDGSYCTYSSHGETGDDPTVDGPTTNQQCGAFKPSNVISFSYGLPESLYPASYLQRQCEEFMKLGLQGSTMVVSSGDGGVAGGHGGQCLGNDASIFNPSAPASCPYVTTVGATLLPEGSQIGDPEAATIRFASGGGFSNIWTAPDYQQAAVSSYFASNDPGFQSYNTTNGNIPTTGGVYNRQGRAFPDIAAVGDYGVVVFKGQSGLIGGTSMSAPIMAAIFTRINDERLKAGKKVIGFANPALYQNTNMFHDITVGDMSGGNGQCNGLGFSAVSGWDPVTGLGTPDYPTMLKYFMSL